MTPVPADSHPLAPAPSAGLPAERVLTAAEFQGLAGVPLTTEWFANLGNAATRRSYENALKDFIRFTGIARAEEFRAVTRVHVLAWRDELVRGEGSKGNIKMRVFVITITLSRLSGIVAKLKMARAAAA
jgi:hypothetical protein